jgi:hypothetical protein
VRSCEVVGDETGCGHLVEAPAQLVQRASRARIPRRHAYRVL